MTDRSVQVEATIALAFLLTTAGLCVHEASRRIRKARLTLYDILLHFAYVDIITKDSLALWCQLLSPMHPSQFFAHFHSGSQRCMLGRSFGEQELRGETRI